MGDIESAPVFYGRYVAKSSHTRPNCHHLPYDYLNMYTGNGEISWAGQAAGPDCSMRNLSTWTWDLLPKADTQ